jgi:hypothetical protein
VIDFLTRILILLRFLCFMAVVYLALHAIVRRCVSKSDSRLLWFFSVLTDPLTRPVRSRLRGDNNGQQVLLISIAVYCALWLCLVLAGRLMD